MRLIDADKLKACIIATCDWEIAKRVEFLWDFINKIPTAYDVGKVIEQLNELLEEKTSDGGEDWYTAECLEKAIEIVKRGGRDD